MGKTQWRGYPRVDPLSPPDGRSQINALADAIDADVEQLYMGYRASAPILYTGNGVFQKGQYPGMRAVLVECIGGGGGSGYMGATGAGQVVASCGGSGGAYTQSWFLASDLSSSETVTVGAGGTAGDTSSRNGGNGGSSSFGSLVTAGGGQGGAASPFGTSGGQAWNYDTAIVSLTRPAGGTPSGTYLIGVRGEGGGGIVFQTPSGWTVGGYTDISGLAGGASGGPYGATGPYGFATFPVNMGFTALPSTGLGVGGGANGGYLPESQSAQNGAAGAAGLVIVTPYL